MFFNEKWSLTPDLAAALERVHQAATFDLVAKFLVLLLIAAGIAALFEVYRHLRAQRLERDRARQLAYQKLYEEARPKQPVAPPAPRPQPVRANHRARRQGGLLRKSVTAAGVASILVVSAAAMVWPFLGTWLGRQDDPERADYIVVLPGDTQRLLKAADLYRQGFAPKVLLGTEPSVSADLVRTLRAEAGYPNVDPTEFQLRVLEKRGVPRASAASFGDNIAGIAEAAEAIRATIDDRKFKLIVVTAVPQALRTKMIFQNAMPRASVMVVAPLDADSEARSDDASLVMVTEAARLLRDWIASAVRGRPETIEPDARAAPASQAKAPEPAKAESAPEIRVPEKVEPVHAAPPSAPEPQKVEPDTRAPQARVLDRPPAQRTRITIQR